MRPALLNLLAIALPAYALAASPPPLPAKEAGALVRIAVVEGAKQVAAGSGVFVGADGSIMTSFALIRYALEEPKAEIELQLSNGAKIRNPSIGSCDTTAQPCVIRAKTKPPAFLARADVGTGAHVLGYGTNNLVEGFEASKDDLSKGKMLDLQDGTALVNSRSEWIMTLSRSPSPSGPDYPAWHGMTLVDFRRKLSFPAVSLETARSDYMKARTQLSDSLKDKYAKFAYAAASDRKRVWSTELFRVVNFGTDPVFSGQLPRWFSHCEHSDEFLLDCNDLETNAYFRVRLIPLHGAPLRDAAAKEAKTLGAEATLSCKDRSGLSRRAPLVIGQECEFIVLNDAYPRAFSIHAFALNAGNAYELSVWSRDPFLKTFLANIPELMRLSAVPVGKVVSR